MRSTWRSRCRRFGVTYPFSSHNYEFRYWLAAGGIDPDRDVKLVVVPPPLTSDALAAGAIDGFCVGAPWNMVASERGVGRIVAAKQDIWPSAPEKVVGMRPEWADSHPETVSRLIVALDAAARWCDRPENHDALAEALADARYIAAPVQHHPSCAGRRVQPRRQGQPARHRQLLHLPFAALPIIRARARRCGSTAR